MAERRSYCGRKLIVSCLLTGTFGFALLLSPPSEAQNNWPNRPHRDSSTASDQTRQEKSPAYQQGYQRGLRDRGDNLEPSTGYSNSNNHVDRPAYDSGYRAGYCHDEKNKTGYYNGIYRGYGPPVVRNGYYGYNAPNPYCEDNGGNSPRHPGDPKAPENHVEYGGAG